MQPSVIVWDLETVPDLTGFAAVNDLVPLLAFSYGAADGSRFAVAAMAVEGSVRPPCTAVRRANLRSAHVQPFRVQSNLFYWILVGWTGHED